MRAQLVPIENVADARMRDSISYVVERVHIFMQLQRKGRSGIGIGYDFDVDAPACFFSCFQCFIEFTACRDTRREPAVTAKCMRQLRIPPGRDIVVGNGGVFTKKALDQIARVVEYEYDRFQTSAPELANFLRRELVRSLAGHQHHTTIRRCYRCAEGSWCCPSNRAPKGLIMESRSFGHKSKGQAHRTCTGLGDYDIVWLDEVRPAGIERIRRNRVVAAAHHWPKG